MNKQEAIDKINNISTLKIRDTTLHRQFDMVDKNKVLGIVSQIDESQKVVVPQFISDWLEVCKENLGFSLSSAMSHYTSAMKAQPKKVQGWFNFKDNQETFAKAWLFGYEVEKEKLYTVEIPNPNCPDIATLLYKENGKVFIGNEFFWDEVPNYKWKNEPENQLTESEIRKDFEWAWQFAEEVKE